MTSYFYFYFFCSYYWKLHPISIFDESQNNRTNSHGSAKECYWCIIGNQCGKTAHHKGNKEDQPCWGWPSGIGMFTSWAVGLGNVLSPVVSFSMLLPSLKMGWTGWSRNFPPTGPSRSSLPPEYSPMSCNLHTALSCCIPPHPLE